MKIDYFTINGEEYIRLIHNNGCVDIYTKYIILENGIKVLNIC